MFNKIFSWFENRLNPYPESNPTTPEKGLFRFIWSSIDGMKGWIFLLAVLTVGTGVMEALLFQFMGLLVDWLGAYSPTTLWQEKGHLLAGMAALLIFSIVWSFVGVNVRLQTLQGVFPMRLRWNFHRLMLGQSLSFYQDEFAGRVSAKVMQTALAVRDTVMTIADMLVYVAVYFITSGLVLAALDTWFLVPFFLWIVAFVTILRLLIPRLAKTAQRQADARSLMTGRITDAYSNIATVKLFSHDAREANYAKRSMEEFMVTVHAQMRLASSLDTLTYATNIFLTLSTAILGVVLWQNGQVGVGAVATATAMALRVNGLSRWIMWESARLFENIGTVNDGMATLTKPHTIVDKPNCAALEVKQGEIKFNNVSFAYDPNKPLLNHFNLTIKPGEKVGLIGRSGAGKSTIVNLLLRFYEAQEGSITIDGQNVLDVSQESLRRQIGLVTQDTSLLHRSVRDNIIYGRPTATDEEMIAAAKAVNAHDFIVKMEKGYDTELKEHGAGLSIGQRQLIAFARTMISMPKILILDEATSSIDTHTELLVQQGIEALLSGRTSFVIAHRLSTIQNADRIFVIDKGGILEQGSPAELMEKKGAYYKLYMAQFAGLQE